ncbi:GAF domain-containing sensor histidine kinase [Nonlabens xiamenensis]|uniref:GAF domain-containing sensor histidine kinase n=1 Tax=Nonlabens xiamenensis TaxID=2341043 RepID=UPI001F0C0879|nr:GAF domain-containing sensor histidine kinase [Nonlabens xiamenensis]
MPWILNFICFRNSPMIPAPVPQNESKRLEAVQKYDLLDTMPEESYDNITSIVASICNAPIALITLMDRERNFIKSGHGTRDLRESPRDISFCGHTIASEEDIVIVEDAREDERFKDNPLIEDFATIFYAGVPLVDQNGYKLGTLCVYDHEPRTLNDNQIDSLKAMAKQVMQLFEQRYQNMVLLKTQRQLHERNQELKVFAGIVTHDLKAPLSNIMMVADLLNDTESGLSEKGKGYLSHLKQSSASLNRYIDGMLMFYRSDEMVTEEYDEVSYIDLIEDVIAMTVLEDQIQVIYRPTQETSIITNEIALQQVMVNLVTNAIKYSDKEKTLIQISLEQTDTHYEISVKDNGQGIAPDKIDQVFKLFYVASEHDKHGKQGTGIGLATVARLLEHMNGKISVSSELGKWTEFKVSLPVIEWS